MTQLNTLNQKISDAYDKTPYTSNAFTYTAPGHLHAVAHLYGLKTPSPNTARVLELGCAAGGNLFPFALAHPNAQVIGVDLSPQQIAVGQQLIDNIGLKNLELRAMSITDIDDSLGKFDYIICHGVFSWVPPEVREAILRVCRNNLSPDGVAYVSYNTYPGWKASDIVRDAMLLNSFMSDSHSEKLVRAKQMLQLLEHGLWDGNALKGALNQAARQVAAQSDSYLAHEYLEAVNSPCYFLEFVAAIQQAGLTYMTDAEPQSTFPSTFGANVSSNLKALEVETTREIREQYLDFAIGRQFRKSLIVHAEKANDILDNPEATKFSLMHVAAKVESVTKADSGNSRERAYVLAAGNTLTTESPALIGVIEELKRAWPGSVSFEKLAVVVASTIPTASQENHDLATFNCLTLLMNASALHYRLDPVPYCSSEPGLRLIPGSMSLLTAPETIRAQIGTHNFWHQAVKLNIDDSMRFVIERLDGSRSQSQIRKELRDALFFGQIVHPQGLLTKGVRNLDQIAQELLAGHLRTLRKVGLLLEAQ